MNESLRNLQGHLFEVSRQFPHRPVPDLLRHVTDWVVLEAAWRRARRAHEPDSLPRSAIQAHLARARTDAAREFCQQLAGELTAGRYQPGEVRRYQIPKPNKPGEFRPIADLNLRDRVVHQAWRLVLEPVIEARLGRQSFAFRPGRSRFDELHAVRRRMGAETGPFQAAAVTDIASFFDRVDHGLLLKDLARLTDDAGALAVLRSLVRQVGSGRRGFFANRPVGVLQGSPLSPLLANWYLQPFDQAWHSRHHDDAPLFRYADDLCFLVRDRPQGRRVLAEARRLLWSTRRLEFSAEKTFVAELTAGVPLLGMNLVRAEDPFTRQTLCRIQLDPARVRLALADLERTVAGIDSAGKLRCGLTQVNAVLRGWFEAWQEASDAPLAFESIDLHVRGLIRERLKSILALPAAQLELTHGHRTPAGHRTWRAEGVELLVLSALPRRPFRPRRGGHPWQEGAPPTASSSPRRSDAGAAAVAMVPDTLDSTSR